MIPLRYTWEGDGWKPIPRHTKIADAEFVIGEEMVLEAVHERSTSTHNHEFAWLDDAWRNLPESLADQYPTPEHLRKRALIEAGYYHEEIIDCGSKAGALRVAGSLRKRDTFLLVVVRGPIVVIREAKSQSRRAMKAADFQASKQAIMDVIAEMIGTTPEALTQAAARAA